MTVRPPSKTTISAPATTTGGQAKLQWGVRWVFPESNLPVSWLGDQAVIIGRDPDNAVFLPGDQMSRKHGTIERQGMVARVRDLGSTNGVFINGNRVTDGVALPGSVLRFGEWLGLLIDESPEDEDGFGLVAPNYWGGSVLRTALAPARRIAISDLPVIVQGETGTGKEGAARAIHQWSGRKGPFLAVNCSALPEALAEGQLFGYRKGAFTGAESANAGYFRSAEGGTLFLDEFADLPATLQPKLLRALEQKEVHPLGEPRPLQVDVRLVVAAQESLADLVESKRLRGDLFARLHGYVLDLPALRERREDIAPLFLGMVQRHATTARSSKPPLLDVRLIEQLCVYDWPFNVRELDLAARRLVALHGHEETLRRSHLPDSLRDFSATSSRDKPANSPAAAVAPAARVAAPEPEAVLEALRAHKGNVARAAMALGISRQKAYRLMQAQGMKVDSLRDEREEPND